MSLSNIVAPQFVVDKAMDRDRQKERKKSHKLTRESIYSIDHVTICCRINKLKYVGTS